MIGGLIQLVKYMLKIDGFNFLIYKITGVIIISSLLAISPAILTQIVIDRVLNAKDESVLLVLLTGILVSMILHAIFVNIQSNLTNYMALKLEYEYQKQLVGHLTNIPIQEFREISNGDIIQRFSDLWSIRDTTVGLVVFIPSALLTLMFSIIIPLVYNPFVAIFAILSAISQPIILLMLTPIFQKANQEVSVAKARVDGIIASLLPSLNTLKSLIAEEWYLRKFINLNDAVMDRSLYSLLITSRGNSLFSMLTALFSLLTLWVGSRQVLDANLTVGQLLAIYGLVSSASSALSVIINNLSNSSHGLIAMERVNSILRMEGESSIYGEKLLPSLTHEISLEKICFSYTKESEVLNNCSNKISKGSYNVMIGSNGSGKSTYCMILTGLLSPTSGDIIWDGHPIKTYSTKSIRSRVLYVPQEIYIFNASFIDNISFGKVMDEELVLSAFKKLGADYLISKLPHGLQTLVGPDSQYGFSSGERQLIGIARALVSNADFIILDEPTANLDTDREEDVISALKALRGEKTLLVVTHRKALIDKSQNVITLSNGHISSNRSPGSGLES